MILLWALLAACSDQDWAREQMEHLQVEPFDLKFAEYEEVNELKQLVKKKEKFEGTEKVFVPTVQTKIIPEEEVLVKCQEAGTYQVHFVQTRSVEVTPEVTKKRKACLGHIEFDAEKFFLVSGAKDKAKTLKKRLARDPSLKSYSATIERDRALGRYYVVTQWRHEDDCDSCGNSLLEEIVVQPAIEKEVWTTDRPEDLASIEANPNCKLLYSQGTDTRQLFFSCAPTSPCAQKGVLVKKQCIKENSFGECDQWEKTYDVGKKAAHVETIGEFWRSEVSYEKNTELPSVATTLSFFSEIEKEGVIFQGEKMRCQCSFIKGVLYDCCKKMDGLAVSAHLARCNSEERALAEKRHAGQCHHVGSRKENFGTQTAQVFCCFSTKLGRIFHEQGRAQLGLGWGTAEEPACQGFSLAELQAIDFTKMDLSDAVEDVAVNKDELMNKVRATIESLQ